jgi:hypothetical protein
MSSDQTADSCQLIALIIEWVEGVAYRIGVTRGLKERDWVALPNRKWKKIVLG